jgi:tetratricopeptide (TPR) repeat protein
LGITLAFFLLAYKCGIKNKFMATFGTFTFFILMASPVWFGAITPLGEQYEHRVYTPMIGMLIFVSQLNINLNSRWLRMAILVMLILFATRTFLRMEVYKTPITYLIEGVKDCPENYIFQSQMGHVLYTQKNYYAALPYFDRAIEKQPGKAQLYDSRANIYLELNKKNEALNDYTKALQLSNHPQFYLSRCLAYKKFNDLGNALRDMEYIKKNFPKVVPPMLELELNVALQSKKMKEISDLGTLILSQPKNAALYVRRAKIYFDGRMGNEALSDLKKACELEPKNQVYKGYYDKLNQTFPH